MNYYLIINLCGIGLWRRLLKNTKESLLEVQFGPTQVSSLHCNFGINVTDESLGGKMYHRSAISHKDYLSYQDDDVRKQCFLTEYTITGTDTRRYFEPEYKGLFR